MVTSWRMGVFVVIRGWLVFRPPKFVLYFPHIPYLITQLCSVLQNEQQEAWVRKVGKSGCDA